MSIRLKVFDEKGGERVDIEVDPRKKVDNTIEGLVKYWGLEGNYELHLSSRKVQKDVIWSATGVEGGEELTLIRTDTERTLPEDMWRKRIENEIDSLKGMDLDMDTVREGDILYLTLVFKDTPGPVTVGNSLAMTFTHQLDIRLGRGYPFEAPRVIWKSRIYHPNILPPEDGGIIRMAYLEDWDFTGNLTGLVHALKRLLVKPELDRRLTHDTCSRAAEKFLEGKFRA